MMDELKEVFELAAGACEAGTKNFVENVLKVKKKKYTIAECIELTRGQYNSEKFEEFFNGSRDYYIKNKIYDSRFYNELINMYWCKKDVPKEINDYMKYCYHYEEALAGVL